MKERERERERDKEREIKRERERKGEINKAAVVCAKFLACASCS